MPWATPESLAPATCGFVFAATGKKYVAAAEHAARSLRVSNPDFPIDLFTDAEAAKTVTAGVFDQVHDIHHIWFRPKFESLHRSRFDRTIYLDADLRVIGDMSDVFEILGKFDFAATQVAGRNQSYARRLWRKPLPNAFPQINGGMIGLNGSEKNRQFIRDCEAAMKLGETTGDQPIFREMLWDSDLRIWILPAEYNARNSTLWRYGGSKFAAPRVLHNSRYVKRMKNDLAPISTEEVYGRYMARHFDRLTAADRTQNPTAKGQVPAPQFDNVFIRIRDRLAKLVGVTGQPNN